MDAKQFAWLYMVENGDVGVKHSFYGGVDIVDKRFQKKPFNGWMKGQSARRKFCLKEIKTYGVDWKKTAAPESDYVSEFNGTFAEPSRTETLNGTIVLKNGAVQIWYAAAIEVTNVFEMMAMIDGAKQRFIEIFGD